MEVKLNCGDKITIPKGCKAKIEDGIITVEGWTPTYHNGDIIHCETAFDGGAHEWLAIVRRQGSEYLIKVHVILFIKSLFENDMDRLYISYCQVVKCDIRLATEEEKQTLVYALEKEGYSWDAEEKRIEKILPRQKNNSTYYYIGNELKTVYTTENGRPIDYANYAIGNYFLTREEAEEYADKIRELLAERRKI